jgi:hypothetical protein
LRPRTAYLRLANGARIHWKSNTATTTLRTVKLFDDLQSTTAGQHWRDFLNGGRSDWDKSSLLNLPAGFSDQDGDPYTCNVTQKGVKVCNWPNYNGLGNGGTAYAGLAEFILLYDTGHLSRGRVRLDDANSGMSRYTQTCLAPPSNTSGSCGTYAHATICQEIGHEFGLDHVAGDTCMGNGYFTSSAFQVHPNGHDYDAIGSSHGHMDAATTASRRRARSSEHERDDGTVVSPPPKGDCRRKQVGPHTFVEWVCGAERQNADEIRIIDYIPALK